MNPDGIPGSTTLDRLQKFGRAINIACFFLLLLVIGTVIYGLILRAVWERNYYIAVGFAVAGGLVLLLGLAQQEIAARDRATWRAMAEWQLRATYDKIAARKGNAPMGEPGSMGDDFDIYYENLVEAVIDDMQRVSSDGHTA